MTILLADSFDFYTSNIDGQYVGSPWAAFSAGGLTATTPYSVGQAMFFSAGNSAQSNSFATNETTIFFAFTHYSLSTFTGTNSQGFFLTFMDAANNQVTLQWAQDGNFYVRGGNYLAAIINGAGWPHGMAANSWCHWQGKVVIDPAAGSVELRKNNNPVDDYSISGLNTRNGSSNSYANKVFFQIANITWYIDDLFINSATGSAPTSWPGQLRATQLMPVSDTSQKDMTPSASQPSVYGTNSIASTDSISANQIWWISPAIVPLSGTVTKITAKLNAGFTGHMKCALYTVSGGNPANLVAQTVEVTSLVIGDNDFTFTTPPTVLANNSYILAFWSDTALSINGAGGLNSGWSQNLTYVAGSANFPANASLSAGTSIHAYSLRATVQIYNAGMVAEVHMDSDTSYVFGSVPGNTDVYNLADLVTVPASIAAVVTRQSFKKSDTGARTATTRVVSGGTPFDQATINLATTYQWQNVYFPTDPNTSAAWTFAAVNALQVGPRIVA